MSLIRLTLVQLLLAALLGCQQQTAPAVPDLDLSFELTDENGLPVTDADFDGKLRLVFFGFTSCPDICPITLTNIATALQTLGERAGEVAVLFITIDPKRDTPERLRAYTDAFHSSVTGLTGSFEQLEAVTSGFRTTFGFTHRDGSGQDRPLSQSEYETMEEPVNYLPFHSSHVYVVSTDNELVDIIGYGARPEKIEETLLSHLR
jgi:protein SCO1/2